MARLRQFYIRQLSSRLVGGAKTGCCEQEPVYFLRRPSSAYNHQSVRSSLAVRRGMSLAHDTQSLYTLITTPAATHDNHVIKCMEIGVQ
eukprot:2217947-Pleurochrysis_carterae.AAC.3